MDLHIVVLLLFYGAVTDAKQTLRTGGVLSLFPVSSEIPDDEQPSKVLAIVAVEDTQDIDEPDVTNPSLKYKTPMFPWIENTEIMWPLLEGYAEDNDEDTSGESNSDEDSVSDTDSDDSDGESNYYDEDDYLKELAKSFVVVNNETNDFLGILRGRWKSCHKKAARYCKKACRRAYKNACNEHHCKGRLKKKIKKECRYTCNDQFKD